MIPRETDFTKQESSTSDNAKASSSSTISWSRLKDPRIVRVSRAFGGKDRHSKVCTVKGLRDRRVRLSVPTAIQLYDLQERLGLNQPSKVVDWLLNAAKHEIDELPPLQIPQGTFSQNLQPLLSASQELTASQSDKQGPKTDWNDPTFRQHRSNIYTGKSKEVSGETSDHRADDESWARNEEERQFNLQNPSSLPNLMNSSIPYNSFVRWDPSNLTLSHPPRSHGLSSQQEDWHNFSLGPLQPPLSGSHQVLLYQPGMSTQPYFPTEFNPKQMNFQNSQLSTSSLSSPVDHSTAQPVRPIHFNMSTANLLPSQNNDESQRDKGNEFHSGQP